MTYPVSGASASESRPKLTVYEYSHAGPQNTSMVNQSLSLTHSFVAFSICVTYLSFFVYDHT